MDEELRKTRILGNRTPLPVIPAQQPQTKTASEGQKETRETGAVGRPVRTRIESPPIYVPQSKEEQPRETTRKPVEPRNSAPVVRSPPYVPPRREDPPKYDPPPKSDPPKRSDPPPTRSEPDRKPSPPLEVRKKDGR
jgi:hypothetical protein